MFSFLGSIVVLILGYFIYGRLMERLFGVDEKRTTPAVAHPDGVDYVQLPLWRIFLIQFLNIAGLGPIFGAIMGIMYGPAAFLWIVLGSIFGGAMHDYLAGMMSVRSNGAGLPDLVGKELGIRVKQFMHVFSIGLMIVVGAVFVSGPAELLNTMSKGALGISWWVVIIFIYYLMATLLPIDKLIGRIYPFFGMVLLFMALGVFIALLVNWAPVPEFTIGFSNMHPAKLPIFPMMFVSIACGAISGFHATQSPLMARCIRNEKLGRRVFYGAMIMEGMVTLTWAAAASAFFGSIEGLHAFVAGMTPGTNHPAVIADMISREWLGPVGGLFALLGIVAAPLSTGDTALRSARIMLADVFRYDQKAFKNRLLVAIPIFIVTYLLLQFDFAIIWRYLSWWNQTLSVFTLWSITVYLTKRKKFYGVSLLPALFMTAVSTSYILIAKEGLQLPPQLAYGISLSITLLTALLFFYKKSKMKLEIID